LECFLWAFGMFLVESYSTLPPPYPIAHAYPWGCWIVKHSLFQMHPEVLNRVNIRGLGRPDKHLDVIVLKPLCCLLREDFLGSIVRRISTLSKGNTVVWGQWHPSACLPAQSLILTLLSTSGCIWKRLCFHYPTPPRVCMSYGIGWWKSGIRFHRNMPKAHRKHSRRIQAVIRAKGVIQTTKYIPK